MTTIMTMTATAIRYHSIGVGAPGDGAVVVADGETPGLPEGPVGLTEGLVAAPTATEVSAVEPQ